MTTELQYDSSKPPKHCPECQKKGVRKKVKVYSINLENEVIIKGNQRLTEWFNFLKIVQISVVSKNLSIS